MSDQHGRTKANVYVNPKAPQWLKDILAEVFPDDHKRLSAEEAQDLIDQSMEARDKD
jgi:hypothetical protein